MKEIMGEVKAVDKSLLNPTLARKVENKNLTFDSPNYLFEGANGMGAGRYVRTGMPYITAYGKALGLTRVEFLELLKARATMGEKLDPMYWMHLEEFGDTEELNALKEIGLIDENF